MLSKEAMKRVAITSQNRDGNKRTGLYKTDEDSKKVPFIYDEKLDKFIRKK